MKKILKMIKPALLFYVAVFILQLTFYFVSPSFYVSNPKELVIPSFIILAFVKYFSLVVALYLLWSVLIGLWNHWMSHIGIKDTDSVLPSYSLLFTQFAGMLLVIGWQIPGLLNNYPGTRQVPLALSYALLLLIAIIGSFFSLKKFFKSFDWTQALLRWASISSLPILLTLIFLSPAKLNLPASKAAKNAMPHVLLLGFDAIDGESSSTLLQLHSQKWGGVVFNEAYTPLPLTHPSWNSILTGLYPKHHQVRYFFDSPYKSQYADQYLAKILKEKNYGTLLAFDQPETSHFNQKHGFDDVMLKKIGWEAHLQAMILNHFIFPGLWLNNRFAAPLTGDRFNYANIFNYDASRFINKTFSKLEAKDSQSKFLALHSCFLHTPVKLRHHEIKQIPQYWKLSPKDFSFHKWPSAGEGYVPTPKEWINPYFLRRQALLNFLDQFLSELGKKDYYKNSLVVFVSDHGERFVKDKEIYGGVHGVDVKTKLQIHVMMSFFHQNIKPQTSKTPTSLIDVAPTVLAFLDITDPKYHFDGLALLDNLSQVTDLPERPIWIESMGYLDDTEEAVEFPQIGVQTLQKSLKYHPNGSVTIGEDYYERIIPKKVIKDITQQNPGT